MGVAGWVLLLALSGLTGPKIYHQLLLRLPVGHNAYWQQRLAEKQSALGSPWRDPRPLILLTGDSHIEYGNWYELLAGGWAVRNGGLAGAKIADVTQLVAAMGDKQPQAVVVMCGINSLFALSQWPNACGITKPCSPPSACSCSPHPSSFCP